MHAALQVTWSTEALVWYVSARLSSRCVSWKRRHEREWICRVVPTKRLDSLYGASDRKWSVAQVGRFHVHCANAFTVFCRPAESSRRRGREENTALSMSLTTTTTCGCCQVRLTSVRVQIGRWRSLDAGHPDNTLTQSPASLRRGSKSADGGDHAK